MAFGTGTYVSQHCGRNTSGNSRRLTLMFSGGANLYWLRREIRISNGGALNCTLVKLLWSVVWIAPVKNVPDISKHISLWCCFHYTQRIWYYIINLIMVLGKENKLPRVVFLSLFSYCSSLHPQLCLWKSIFVCMEKQTTGVFSSVIPLFLQEHTCPWWEPWSPAGWASTAVPYVEEEQSADHERSAVSANS